MTTFKLSKLLGINIIKPEKDRAIILGQRAINSLVKCFKKERFGILTFQSVTPSKRKNSSHILLRYEEELKRLSLNYLQISAHWHIRMRDVFSTKELGYFILNPSKKQMQELTKLADQSLFVFGENGDINLYYSNGVKVEIENDIENHETEENKITLLNLVDFKLYLENVFKVNIDIDKRKKYRIGEKRFILSFDMEKNEFNSDIINIYDIRQNAIIAYKFNKSNVFIKPKVFHFDEIILTFKL